MTANRGQKTVFSLIPRETTTGDPIKGHSNTILEERRALLHRIYDRLFEAFGPQYWWPAETPFEVMLGAILTQNTAWRNVEYSIAKLRENGLLDLHALHTIGERELASFIRSSGYFNQKARSIKELCSHILHRRQGNLDRFLSLEMEALRPELLSIRGVGPETADCIILYAACQPSFVVDTYTNRIFSRHGWIAEPLRYNDLRSYFMECLDPDVPFFQEFHALFVRLGHLYCRRKPLCDECLLNRWRGGVDRYAISNDGTGRK